MDAIDHLIHDHQNAERIFRRFEKAGRSANQTKGKLVGEMITHLSKHSAVEEALFYPAARRVAKDKDPRILKSLEEHHAMKWTLAELENVKPTDERFDAKVAVLMEMVRKHVEEEEADLFPRLRRAFTREQLLALGEQLEALDKLAPTHPHPRSPDQPPGALLATPMAAMMDLGRDMLRRTFQTAKEKSRVRQAVMARFAKARRGQGAGERKGR